MKNIKSLAFKLIIGGTILVAAIILFAGYSIYMNYLQVSEIGGNFLSVFMTNLNTNIVTQVISFLIVFALILTNLLIVRRVMMKVDVSFQFIKNVFPIFILSFVFAFFASGYIKETLSRCYLLFSNSVSFGTVDPVFNQDLSYYVFIRPFLISLLDSLMGVCIFITIMTTITYVLLYSRLGILQFGEIIKIKGLTIHTLSNLILIIMIKAVSYKFSAEDILFSEFGTNGSMAGAGYTDINIWLKFNTVAPVILIILVFLSLIFLYNGKFKHVIITILVYPVLYVAVALSALFTQYFIVQPSEMQIEEPYIERNINFTRMAYGLDKIEEVEFKAETNLTAKDLEEERKTVDNARIVDYEATVTILNQLQSLRNYYEFKDLDIAVYDIGGEKTPIAVAARELKKSREDASGGNYTNDKLKYTHGYGVVSAPINKVTEEGHPIFYTKDMPLTTEAGTPEVTEPRIYFGEFKSDYSIVNTSFKEIDYMEGEKVIETSYQGEAGIKLTPFKRFLFSMCYGDYQILTSNYINGESKILMNKNVVDRVKTVASFLTFDEEACIIIGSDGRLKWVVDGYTETNQIPYSQETVPPASMSGNGRRFNYIRNSVKAVVDAYDGTVTLYITDEDDKLIQAYRRIYPDAFSPESMPEDLRYSVKYPEYYFKAQAEQLKKYHTADVTTFYTRSDVWEFSYEKSGNESKRLVEPYYNTMNIDGNFGLVIMSPFTIQEKNNMVSWFAVGSDSGNYGKMTLYKFPPGKNVYGAYQIDERIDSNTEISKLFTLWSGGGSSVMRGNIITLPIKDSLLFIKPIYITSGKNTFPELKSVIAAYGDKIAMEATLKQALDVLFKGAPATVPVTDKPGIAGGNSGISAPTPSPTPSAMPSPSPPLGEEASPPYPPFPGYEISEPDAKQKVTAAFDKVSEASKAGDWETFGKAMAELEKAVGEMNEKAEETPQP
jgi:uncharacterized membrane protein (UPF0182 family)